MTTKPPHINAPLKLFRVWYIFHRSELPAKAQTMDWYGSDTQSARAAFIRCYKQFHPEVLSIAASPKS